MIQLEQACKEYSGVVALHPTDLSVPAGQTTVLIGPSGCGKSTMLHLMAGLVDPSSGMVYFDGQALGPGSIQAFRRRMGYVIQGGGLFPHLTARRNVTLMARHLRWQSSRIKARLEAMLALVGLEAALLDRHPGRLSGGQQQRVSLMRALFLDPDVLLLDEPLGALDPMIRYELQEELRAIFQKLHKTVIMVTHDMAEAAYFGDTIVLLKAGRKLQHGTLQTLVRQPADPFVTAFLRAQRTVPLP